MLYWPGERSNCLTSDAGTSWCSIHHSYWPGERNICLTSDAGTGWCSVHHSCWPGERNNCLTLDAGPGCCSIHHRYWSGEREKQLITSVVALTMKTSSSQLLVWQTTVLNQMLVLADALFIIDTGLENKGHNLLHQMLVLHEAQFIIFAGLEKDWDTCIKSDAGTAWRWSSVYYHERYGENCITSDTVLAWTSADLSYQHKKEDDNCVIPDTGTAWRERYTQKQLWCIKWHCTQLFAVT